MAGLLQGRVHMAARLQGFRVVKHRKWFVGGGVNGVNGVNGSGDATGGGGCSGSGSGGGGGGGGGRLRTGWWRMMQHGMQGIVIRRKLAHSRRIGNRSG